MRFLLPLPVVLGQGSVVVLSGGTGSGLGARLTEELSDVMADVTRLNIAIGPYHMGVPFTPPHPHFYPNPNPTFPLSFRR